MLKTVQIVMLMMVVSLLSGCSVCYSALGETIRQNSCNDIHNHVERMECERHTEKRLDYYKNKNATGDNKVNK
jgi:hypothetical protein